MTEENYTPPSAARKLVRACDRAVLSTALAENAWPYGSLVMTACSHDARPLLMISDLAEHTKNLKADPRGSLLFDGTAGLENPLTSGRVTVLGRFSICEDEASLTRYVSRHPDAEMYLGFADFHLYEMSVERAHIVSGFGEIHWIDVEDLLFDTTDTGEIATAEADIVSHMNEDHSDAVSLYATALLGLPEGNWQMTGIDPEGIDLRDGGEVCRLSFDTPVNNAELARATLVEMVKSARAR